MGYMGTFSGHKSRTPQAAAGFDQGEVTHGSALRCCSPSRVWLCCIVLGSPPAYSRAQAAPAPAAQKSAQSVASDAPGVWVSTQSTSASPPGTALLVCQPRCGQECAEELGLPPFGAMETLQRAAAGGTHQPAVASPGCSCCLYTSAPELDWARHLTRNFSVTWWISHWLVLSLVYEKKLRKPI